MAKLNRYHVAKSVGELTPATTASVAAALEVEADSDRLETAIESAAKHGLIEKSAADGDDAWTQTDKGKRKVEAKLS